MTAIQAYYRAVKLGRLPAIVPFRTASGQRALGTMVFPIESEIQTEMVFSPDQMVRAKACVFACVVIHEQIGARAHAR